MLDVAAVLYVRACSMVTGRVSDLRWSYLLFLGGRMIISSIPGWGHKRLAAGSTSDSAAVRQGTVNNLTNPKSLLFMFAFLPQFITPASGPIWTQLLDSG